MAVLSETEATLQRQVALVLESLPSVRRWLVHAARVPDRPEGHNHLPLSHVRVLLDLALYGPMTMGQLARRLGISCSTATECVAGLESRGRVMKQRSLSDRRQVMVSLTPEAERIASQVLAQRQGVVERVITQLSPAERQAFVKGLTLLGREVEEWIERVRPYA
ncbi:MAG: MarR family transcriptional regulator [Dehalococcoidia bacterium]|nr:MarR family transcriptional regulator [Dehalococcoidia bacterium]